MRSSMLTSLALALAAPIAVAGGEGGRTEITLLLGASLQEPSMTRRFPDFYYLRGGPTPLSGFEERTSLGGSVLQGFKVGRALGDRVVLEAGFSIAPTHERRIESDFPGSHCPECVVAYDGTTSVATSDGHLIPFPVPGLLEERVVAYGYDAGMTFDLATGAVRPYVLLGAGGVTYDASTEPTQTDFRLSLGGGLRLGSGSVRARVEVVDALTPDHFLTGDTEHDVQVRFGVSVRVP